MSHLRKVGQGRAEQSRVKYYEKEKAAGKAALNVMQRALSERSDQALPLGEGWEGVETFSGACSGELLVRSTNNSPF